MRALTIAVFGVVLTGCTFGINQCNTNTDCATPGAVCTDGFCTVSTTGGGSGGGSGGGTGGGSAGGGGGTTVTGGGGGETSCTQAVIDACKVWEECSPTESGGTCVDSGYEVSWVTPSQDFRTKGSVIPAEVTVRKQDGGVVPSGLIPIIDAPAGTTATVQNASYPLQVQLSLGGTDGIYTFNAGWDGGPQTPLRVHVDRTGPQFELTLSSDAGATPNTPEFIPADPNSLGAFRKDAVIKIRATTDAGDVANVSLVAQFGGEPEFTVTTSSNCTVGAGRCDEFELDLSRVSMTEFRGEVSIRVTAVDNLNNTGAELQPLEVSVTRWNWARQIGAIGGSLKSTPAIGTNGRIYVGRANGDGGVIALNPDGQVLWAISDDLVEGPIATGRGMSNTEYVFFNTQSGQARSAHTTGVLAHSCGPGNAAPSNAGGVTVLGENTANVGSISLQPAANIAGGANRGVYVMADGASCRDTGAGGLPSIHNPANMVAGGNGVYYVNSNGKLRMIEVDAGGSPTADALSEDVGIGSINGLALLSPTRVIGGGAPESGKFSLST